MDTRIGELITKQLKGEITPDEYPELNQFDTATNENRQLIANLTNSKYLLEEMKLIYGWNKDRGWKTIAQMLNMKEQPVRNKMVLFRNWLRNIISLILSQFVCMHVTAQTAPVVKAKPSVNSNFQSDTVTNWMRSIPLLHNECIALKRPKILDYIYVPMLLNFQAAIDKAVLINKRDSLYKAAGLFVKAMRKSLHLNKTSKVVIGVLYFDKYRCNAGLSRSLVFFINGHKTIITDTTYDDSSLMDSAVSSRLETITLAPNQYILVDHEKQALSICSITKKCDKDEALTGDPIYTRARIAALLLLFEVLQRDFSKYKAVAYACIDPLGARKTESTGYDIALMDLIHQYNALYLDYLQDLRLRGLNNNLINP
jgi:hypothetical protein